MKNKNSKKSNVLRSLLKDMRNMLAKNSWLLLLLLAPAVLASSCNKECQDKGQTRDGYRLDEDNCEWVKIPEPPVNLAELKRQEIHQFYRDSVTHGYKEALTIYIELFTTNPGIKDTTRCAPLARDDYVTTNPKEENKRKANKFVDICAQYDALTK